jgi:ribosome biogenesis GTPase / thiamine phosphate phosphatase
VNSLESLGWSDFFERQWEALGRHELRPARVVFECRGLCLVVDEQGEGEAVLSGRFRNGGGQRPKSPSVGDWVVVREASGARVVEHRFERRTVFERAGVGGPGIQVVAANVDTVLVVTSLNRDFNVRRLERYLTTVWNSGADPVVVLNKADLVEEPDAFVERLGPLAVGLPVHVVSGLDGRGTEVLEALDRPGHTLALVGSSGVGKSTLVNRLLGFERQAVREIREDDARGRHMTTRRDLLRLPGGGWVIDTPGMRELGLVGDDEGVALTFADVEDVAGGCQFRDCQHEGEPGCAVEEAVRRGSLDGGRVESYRKLKRELAYARRKVDPEAERSERRRVRALTKAYRSRPDKREGE